MRAGCVVPLRYPMNPKNLVLALSAFISIAPFALGDAAPNTLTPEESSAGWKLLFDGHSLNGWRGFKEIKPGAGWRVDGDALTVSGKAGDLLTAQEYGDFELSFEWKVSIAANSGVLYRVGLDESATFRTGPEYQVLDNAKAEDNRKPSHLAGALYDLVAPPKDYTKPVGEWNSGRIAVRGWHIQHWLNGEKIVDVDLANAEGKALIAASKFNDWSNFATLARGYVALQEHGHIVSFRSIKIRELK